MNASSVVVQFCFIFAGWIILNGRKCEQAINWGLKVESWRFFVHRPILLIEATHDPT